ncbi:cytochrome P450 71A3-like isoform X2 [Miscanthus floridulus]|uniref:cytochrome P450 71A3-like isoform X2 n=1 Tax=Miscanthus floridulus TaxID=154761 RepID=UPI0034586C09
MALGQEVAPVTLLLTVLIAAPLTVLLLLAVAGNKKPASAAAPTPRRDGRRLPLPPSPRGFPLLGHLHLLGALPHRALASLARAHGPVLLLRLGRVPTVVVSSAAAAEEVMRARDLAFASRPRSAMAERLLYGRDVAFAPYGEYWRQARRVCVVHLLSSRRVGSFSFCRIREQEATVLAARVAARASAGAGGAAVDLSELLTEYANAVVSRAAFGDESARGLFDEFDSGRRQRKVITDFQKLIGTVPVGELLPWLGWVDAITGLERKIRRTFEALDGLLEKVIDDHRRRPRRGGGDGDGRDFVDVLLDVHKNDKEHGIQLETNEIKAIILYSVLYPEIFFVYRAMHGRRRHLAGHVRGRHGHDSHGDGMGHGGARHPPARHAESAGRGPRGGGRLNRSQRGPRRAAGLPQGRGEGDAPAARAGAAAGAPGAAGGRRDPGVPRPGAHARAGQRLGHRPGPRDVGARRGVRAGEILGWRRRRVRRLQGAALRAAAVRRRQEDVPRDRVRGGKRRDGAGELAVSF